MTGTFHECCCDEPGGKTVSLYAPWRGFPPFYGHYAEFIGEYSEEAWCDPDNWSVYNLVPKPSRRFLVKTRDLIVTNCRLGQFSPPWCPGTQEIYLNYTRRDVGTLHKHDVRFDTYTSQIIFLELWTVPSTPGGCDVDPGFQTILEFLDTIYTDFYQYLLEELIEWPGSDITTAFSVTETVYSKTRNVPDPLGYTSYFEILETLSSEYDKSSVFTELTNRAQTYNLLGAQLLEMVLDYGDDDDWACEDCTIDEPTVEDCWFAPADYSFDDGSLKRTDAILVYYGGDAETAEDSWRVTSDQLDADWGHRTWSTGGSCDCCVTTGYPRCWLRCGFPDYYQTCFQAAAQTLVPVSDLYPDGTRLFSNWPMLYRQQLSDRNPDGAAQLSACLAGSPTETTPNTNNGISFPYLTSLIAIRRTSREVVTPSERCLVRRDFTNEVTYSLTTAELCNPPTVDPATTLEDIEFSTFGLLRQDDWTCLTLNSTGAMINYEPVADSDVWVSSTDPAGFNFWPIVETCGPCEPAE